MALGGPAGITMFFHSLAFPKMIRALIVVTFLAALSLADPIPVETLTTAFDKDENVIVEIPAPVGFTKSGNDLLCICQLPVVKPEVA